MHTQAEKVQYEKMVESISESYETALSKSKQLSTEVASLRGTLSALTGEVLRGKMLLEAIEKEKAGLEAQLRSSSEVQTALKTQASEAVKAMVAAQNEVLCLLLFAV